MQDSTKTKVIIAMTVISLILTIGYSVAYDTQQFGLTIVMLVIMLGLEFIVLIHE